MARKTTDRTLIITIGPDSESQGTAWYVVERTEDGNDSIASGGSARRPQGISAEHWLDAARRLVSAEVKGIQWASADAAPYGYSDGWFHCPHGVRIVAKQRVPVERW